MFVLMYPMLSNRLFKMEYAAIFQDSLSCIFFCHTETFSGSQRHDLALLSEGCVMAGDAPLSGAPALRNKGKDMLASPF